VGAQAKQVATRRAARSNRRELKNARMRTMRRGPGHPPTPCTAAVCRTAMHLTMLGCTRQEVCERLDIASSVFDRWMREEPLFKTAITTARNIDGDAVGGLHRRATGCEVFEEKVIYNPSTGEVEKHKLWKEIPPSEVAAMMLLSNRHPERWRWRANVDHTNSDGSFKAFADAMRLGGKGRTLEHEYVDPEQRLLTNGHGGNGANGRE
jgi:hypothetical protein